MTHDPIRAALEVAGDSAMQELGWEHTGDFGPDLQAIARDVAAAAIAAFHDQMEAHWRNERGEPCRADTHSGMAAAVRRAAGGG